MTPCSWGLFWFLFVWHLKKKKITSAAASYLWWRCLHSTLSLSDKLRVQPFLCSRLVSHSEELYLQHQRQEQEKTNKTMLTAASHSGSFRKAFWSGNSNIENVFGTTNNVGSLMLPWLFFQVFFQKLIWLTFHFIKLSAVTPLTAYMAQNGLKMPQANCQKPIRCSCFAVQ